MATVEDDVPMQNPPEIPDPTVEPKYGGFTRFEIELEVWCSPR